MHFIGADLENFVTAANKSYAKSLLYASG